jgi:hypothetical protein
MVKLEITKHLNKKIAYNKLLKKDKIQLAFAPSSLILVNYILPINRALCVKEEYVNFQEMDEHQILSIANPIMDNLMDASTEIDHAQHVSDFSDRLKSIVTKDYLEAVCKDYQNQKGYFKDREFVALFKRPQSVAIVWKQTFTKAQGDFVAEMALIHKNGKYLVDHVMVF